jgi:hypothetical protein
MRKLWFIATIIALTVFVSYCGDKGIPPDEILGVWKTSEPKYADRSFGIGKESITFGIGKRNFKTYLTKKIHVQQFPQDNSRLYTIYYEDDEGEKGQFAFYYYYENGGVIRLKNQRNIEWKKEQGNS